MEETVKGLLVVSFGTTHKETRDKNIIPLEESLRKAFPERIFFRSFTSPTVRRAMREQEDILVDSPLEALNKMRAGGVTDILVVPTHVIPGIEMDKLWETTDQFRKEHPDLVITVAHPLLWEEKDYRICASAVLEDLEAYAKDESTAILFLGHGTPHKKDECYDMLEQAFREQASDRVYVVTVEGHRGVGELLPELKEKKYERILLLPFMLVAGEHAAHDMAGEQPDSIVNRLRGAGLSVSVRMKGLGEYRKLREYYVRRAKELSELSDFTRIME